MWNKPMTACGVMIVVAGMATLGTVGCTSGGGESDTTIRIDGSSTVYPISSMLMELYGEEHSAARIVVGYSGTGGGMKKFIAGEIDICDASRAIQASEVEACQNAGVDFVELEVAYDGLAIVVSTENDWCDCLTVEQLGEIWKPDNPAKKWSDLNPSWPAEVIVLYGPGVDSGTFDYFTEAIVGEAKKSRSDYSPSENDNVLVTGVSSNKYALGYFGFFYYEENSTKLKLVGVDAGNGCIQPTMDTVSNNTYSPLSRPLYIYVRDSSLQNPTIAEFVSYYLDNAAEAAKQVGYVPVKSDIQDDNLKKLAEAIKQ